MSPADAYGETVESFRFELHGAGPAALALAWVPAAADTHAAIGARWLSGAEHDRNSRFAVAHARADFLAGRIAAKTAARILDPHSLPAAQWEIVPGENHQPRIGHVLRDHAVSLAHAGGLGLGAVFPASVRCGVDLEAADRDAGDVIATQVTPEEAAWARAGGDEQRTRWMLLWTAREAQGKSYGTGLLDPQRLVATRGWTPASHGWRARFAGNDAALVRAVVAGRWVVALVFPAETETDPIARWLAATLSASVIP